MTGTIAKLKMTRARRDTAIAAAYMNAPDGMTLKELGDAFGLTQERARQILASKGIQGGRKRVLNPPLRLQEAERAARRQWKKDRLAKAIELYDSGLSLAQVGERLGCGWNNVKGILDRAGHKRRKPGGDQKSKGRLAARSAQAGHPK
jgi:DNA-binding transcriptional regulator LsrR (DeoR family)